MPKKNEGATAKMPADPISRFKPIAPTPATSANIPVCSQNGLRTKGSTITAPMAIRIDARSALRRRTSDRIDCDGVCNASDTPDFFGSEQPVRRHEQDE